jgi:hypothetical protein
MQHGYKFVLSREYKILPWNGKDTVDAFAVVQWKDFKRPDLLRSIVHSINSDA